MALHMTADASSVTAILCPDSGLKPRTRCQPRVGLLHSWFLQRREPMLGDDT